MRKLRIKGGHDYFALLCYCVGNEKEPKPMICGVYSTREEAEEVGKEVEGCGAKHKIKKCSVSITLR